LKDRYADEPHWGVRIEIVRALGDSGTVVAAQALARLLDQESDPRAMFAVAQACGRYRDPDIARALEAYLERDDLPYQARHDALVALGRQRGGDHLETLRAAAQSRNWWRWTRRGALIGLGETRTEEGRRFLVGRVAYGAEETNVRQAAVVALAEGARWQERAVREQTLEVLIDLTRDPVYPVRQATVNAIRVLGEPAGIPAMTAAVRSLAPQEGPRIERAVAALRKEAGPGEQARNLAKQVDELQVKLRKLQHRIGTLEERARDDEDDE
jgi:aminopeptidase N